MLALFLSLELVRENLQRGESVDQAIESTRAQTVFTTHTPVPAGHDVFHPDAVNAFMSDYFHDFREGSSVVPRERLLALGARPADIGQTGEEQWHVLTDPEGNEFCLLKARLDPL